MHFSYFIGIYFIVACTAASCQNSTTGSTNQRKIRIPGKEASLSPAIEQKAVVESNQSAQPKDSLIDGQILMPYTYRVFDDNNVSKIINPSWLELHRKDGKYNIGKAVYSIVYEKEEPCAGLPTETINPKADVLLFFNISALQPGPVDSIPFHNKIVPPNQPMEFSFKNDKYKLVAAGIEFYKDENTNIEHPGYTLKLFINNKFIRTLIDQDAYHDTATELEFIGDLDRDGILDFIISSPRDYEEHRKILILSTQKFPYVGTVQFDC
ncbi:hypothetical protein [Sphingobacterium sp. WOUb80]|uniref:hypothetical protein n=1 Tax=Sphingobacterium sp. WOUb80 TaxID=3234028 RepID=UPI003CFB4775